MTHQLSKLPCSHHIHGERQHLSGDLLVALDHSLVWDTPVFFLCETQSHAPHSTHSTQLSDHSSFPFFVPSSIWNMGVPSQVWRRVPVVPAPGGLRQERITVNLRPPDCAVRPYLKTSKWVNDCGATLLMSVAQQALPFPPLPSEGSSVPKASPASCGPQFLGLQTDFPPELYLCISHNFLCSTSN